MKFLCCLLCLLVLFVPACSLLSAQQRDNIRDMIGIEYREGNITRAQRDAAIEALENDQPFNWSALGIAGINAALALIGGPLIVRRIRGPATQRVGLPKSKVREA